MKWIIPPIILALLALPAAQGQNTDRVPLFQFAAFYYQDDLEFCPGANMTINGPVHGNQNIYLDPNSGVSLTFASAVTAAGNVLLEQNPLDPSSRPITGSAVFDYPCASDVSPWVIGPGYPVATNAYSVLQVPPPGEHPNGMMGTNRLYNMVDMIITISNGNVITVSSGIILNNAATIIPSNQWSGFISTNGNFFNMRDGAQVSTINLDVGNLRKWSATNTILRPLIANAPWRDPFDGDMESIFIADERFLSNTLILTNIAGCTTNTVITTTGYFPANGTYLPPVATNTTQTTSAIYPADGTYVPPIETTNTTSTTTTNLPSAGTYTGTISTNTANTNSFSAPDPGSYSGSVTTNTSYVTNTSYPAAGTYVGTVTTNKSHNIISGYSYYQIDSYTYNLIEYTYNLITGYIYEGITGYTYAGITGLTTNYAYTTNYVQYAEPGIVLTNGGWLPSNGLTVVTPDPCYIVGNWNCTNGTGQGKVQSFDVSRTLPSAIYADAVTILSPAWNPNCSTNSMAGGARNAAPDTVNAAIVTGTVPSDGFNYSGGLENFLRFQENWSGVEFYYNGSLCCLFDSQIANYPWPGTGVVYNPPTRCWAWNTNYANPANLPELMPWPEKVMDPVLNFQAAAVSQGQGINLSWTAEPGMVYQVQFTTNLPGGNWQNLGTAYTNIPYVFQQRTVNDSCGNPQTFYRIVATSWNALIGWP